MKTHRKYNTNKKKNTSILYYGYVYIFHAHEANHRTFTFTFTLQTLIYNVHASKSNKTAYHMFGIANSLRSSENTKINEI